MGILKKKKIAASTGPGTVQQDHWKLSVTTKTDGDSEVRHVQNAHAKKRNGWVSPVEDVLIAIIESETHLTLLLPAMILNGIFAATFLK